MTKLTEQEQKEVCEHYKHTLTLRQIAGFYDTSHENIRQILIRHGVKLKPPHKNYNR